MIDKSRIKDLVKLFRARGVKFYHACQLKDFKSYLKIGGIPSRHLLESSGMIFTPLDTDSTDRNNNVWNKVFGNLSDFGRAFAEGRWRSENKAPVPNPYGPILFIFEPEIFTEATDVAICLRSAGGTNFDRDSEALSSVAEVDRIFKYSIEEALTDDTKSYIKFANELKKEFKNEKATSPEVSCSVSSRRLSFEYLSRIIVDPYEVEKRSLIKQVEYYNAKHNVKCPVWERKYKERRKNIIVELGGLLVQCIPSLSQLIENPNMSQELKDWARRLLSIEWQYERFVKYLRIGTVLELINTRT